MDDFGVKYVGKQYAEHLITCIQEYYPVSIDWNGKLYFVFSFDWDYKQKHLTMSMKFSLEGSMNEYQQKMTTPPQNAPHKSEQPDYVAKIQWEAN